MHLCLPWNGMACCLNEKLVLGYSDREGGDLECIKRYSCCSPLESWRRGSSFTSILAVLTSEVLTETLIYRLETPDNPRGPYLAVQRPTCCCSLKITHSTLTGGN